MEIMDYFWNVFEDVWPMITIFSVVLISIRLTYLKVNGEKFKFYNEFLNFIFLIYSLTLFQLLTNNELNNYNGLNLVPFQEILRYRVGTNGFRVNVIGNILIFVPFGFFVARTLKKSNFLYIFIISALTSATVETIQYNIGRTFDIDDILLNVTGAIIGYFIYKLLSFINRHMWAPLRSEVLYNIICLILALIAVYFYLKLVGLNI